MMLPDLQTPFQTPSPPQRSRQATWNSWGARPARHAVALLGLVGLLVAGGCQAEPEPTGQHTNPTVAPASPAPTTPSPAPTPQPQPTREAEQAVLAVYARFWEVYVAAASQSDPNHPELVQVATGPALEGLRIQLTGDRQAGLVGRGQPVRWATRLTRLQGHRAALTECLDSNRWLLHDAATGELRDTPSGIVRQVDAVLSHTQEGWKVAELDIGTTDVRETLCAR